MSVCGTVSLSLELRDFSRKFALINPPRRTVMFMLQFRLSLKKEFRIYQELAVMPQTQIQLCAYHTNLRPPIAIYKGHGLLTMCPSCAAIAIHLGPTNPSLIVIAKETLVFRCAGFSPALWLLVPTFLLQHAPPWVTPLASSQS